MLVPLFGLMFAAVLAGLGYLALWTARRPETARGLAAFGRVLAIVLFCTAGIGLLAGLVAGPMMLAGRGPGLCGGAPGLLGTPGREIRIERRFAGPPGEMEEHMHEMLQEMCEESPELEERVRDIVLEMFGDEMFERRVLEVVRKAGQK